MYIAFAVGELEASRYVDVIGLSTSSAHEAVNNAYARCGNRAFFYPTSWLLENEVGIFIYCIYLSILMRAFF